MALTPTSWALAGEALFNQDWVYGMRRLLDIRKENAEQIAYANAHHLPFEIPPRLRRPIHDALLAKIAQCQAAIDVLAADEATDEKKGPAVASEAS